MQKNFDQRKGHLQSLMNELNNSIGINEKKYFHLQTIENLIFHFERVKTENDKNWIYETIVVYFKRCSEIMTSIDRNTSKDLFYEHVDKVTDYYHNNLGFVLLINRTIVYLIYFLILLLCYIFLNFYVVIIVASLLMFQTFRVFKKYKEKMVYGLFW